MNNICICELEARDNRIRELSEITFKELIIYLTRRVLKTEKDINTVTEQLITYS